MRLGAAKADRPSEVSPERFSRRSDFSGGKDNNVLSLNEGAGKDETCKFSRDGKDLKMSVNNKESIVPFSLQCKTSVCNFDQFE